MRQDSCLLLGRDTCLLLRWNRCLHSKYLCCPSSRHVSCLNSRHLSCLSRRHPSWLHGRHLFCCKSCVNMSEVSNIWSMPSISHCQRSQSSQCQNVGVSDNGRGPKSLRWGNLTTTIPEWSPKRLGIPRQFQAFGTGPAVENLTKKSQNDMFGVSRWGHFAV